MDRDDSREQQEQKESIPDVLGSGSGRQRYSEGLCTAWY